jgi:hypothetical protein
MNPFANIRNAFFTTALVFGLLGAVCGVALAQPQTAAQLSAQNAALNTTASKVGSNDEVVCKRETQRYVQTLGYLKIAAGDKITDFVKHGIIDDAQLAELIARDGYCGVARTLKDRRLL